MTTKNTFKAMRRGIAALALAGTVIGYAQPTLDASWNSTTAKNKYTTSGGALFNDCPVIQNDIGAVVNGISADLFTNYVSNTRVVNENDFTLSKTFSNDKVSVTPSVAVWTFPNTSYNNAKIAGLSISSNKPILELDAKISGLKSWAKESNGTTIDLSLSKGYNLTDKLSVRADYTANVNLKFYSSDSGFAGHNLGITADYKINPALTISVGVKRQFHNPSYNGGSSHTIFQIGTNVNILKLGGKSK